MLASSQFLAHCHFALALDTGSQNTVVSQEQKKCCGVRHKLKYFHFIFFLLKTIVFS